MMKREQENFKNYCWPIFGDHDTTLIYKYELRCLDYDTSWFRYYKIKAYTEDQKRYFDYSVFQSGEGMESNHTYLVDSSGIHIEKFKTLDSEKRIVSGHVAGQKMFDWDLDRMEVNRVRIEFKDSNPSVFEREVNTSTRFMGAGSKVKFNKEKFASIRFERSVERIKGDSVNTSHGISYYAEGLGYFGAYILFNDEVAFEERLVEIRPITTWKTNTPVVTNE